MSSRESVLDLAMLEEQAMGMPEVAEEVLGLFLTQCATEIDELVQRAGASDRPAVRHLAHSLKSSAAIVGANLLRSALERLEHGALTEPPDQLLVQASLVLAAYTEVRPVAAAARTLYATQSGGA